MFEIFFVLHKAQPYQKQFPERPPTPLLSWSVFSDICTWLIGWIYVSLKSLHCTGWNRGPFCGAGGGMCLSISSCTYAIALARCWTCCGNFSNSGERGKLCLSRSSFADPSSERAVPGWQLQPRTADPAFCDWGASPSHLLLSSGNLPCSYSGHRICFSSTVSGCLKCNYLHFEWIYAPFKPQVFLVKWLKT